MSAFNVTDGDLAYLRNMAVWEREMVAAAKCWAAENATEVQYMWEWGDGHGGGLLEIIRDAAGIPKPVHTPVPAASQVTSAKRWAIFKRDGYACLRCGGDSDLTIDHIVPRSKGGANAVSNLQTLCRSCNCSKGNRL